MKSSSEQKIIKMSHLIFVTVWMKTRIPLVKSMNILLMIIPKNLILYVKKNNGSFPSFSLQGWKAVSAH